MAKPKVRTVTMTAEFTMKRAGDAKGDEAWTAILKAIQRVLGEKYDVQRLIVSRELEPPEHQPDDKVFEAGWRKGEWEAWYEYSGLMAEDQAREEAREAELAAQVAEEDAEAEMELHDLAIAEEAEQAPDEPDPSTA